MVRSLVLRGAAAGVLGGLLAFVFSWVFAGSTVQAAIDYEAGRAAAEATLEAAGHAAHDAEPELFSRAVQGSVGLGLGVVAFGLAMGLFCAVAFCMAYGRTGSVRPRPLALLVALAGFVTFFLVPFLTYPSNPPAVGNHDTIRDRAALWLLMVVASVALVVAATWLGRRLQARWGTWTASLVAGAAFVVVTGTLMAVLPAVGELAPGGPPTDTPQPLRDPAGAIAYPGFDADVLYLFRLYSVGAQAVLWTTIGLVFAPLADRVFRRHGMPSQREMAAP